MIIETKIPTYIPISKTMLKNAAVWIPEMGVRKH